MKNKEAIVVGGSIGGLFVANMLSRAGWSVNVYEYQANGLESRGAGIATHLELMNVLQHAGVDPSRDFGVHVSKRITLDKTGDKIAELPLPQVFTAWGRIYKLLKDEFNPENYHNGKKLVDFESTSDGVTAMFEDGAAARADMLIGADGLRSVVRSKLLPACTPRYAGYVAWRGMVDESELSPRTLSEVFPFLAFDLPDNEQMVGYPVAGSNNSVVEGDRRFNFVWYRPAGAGELKEMLTDASGKHWPEGIPPPLVRPHVVDRARADAQRILSPQLAEIVTKTKQLFFQPIFDLESSQIAFDRIALLGDAAFVARPHCGMGVTKAGSDAHALVNALSDASSVTEGLRAYERARLPYGVDIVAHARNLGAYMQSVISTEEEKKMAEVYRTPEAVMRETGVPPAFSVNRANH